MTIYTLSLENTRYGKLMPQEDAFATSSGTIFAIADGITRDPITNLTLATHTIEELLTYYPDPSGAKWAADIFCEKFCSNIKEKQSIYQAFLEANKAIYELNTKHIEEVDYLQNDYFGCVAAGGAIKENILEWGVIGDCGIIVYSKEGVIRFQTPNSMQAFEDAVHKGTITFKWETAEGRRFVRSKCRNNPDQKIADQCVSYGALTGEKSAESFIYSGELALHSGDWIFFYTDGFEPVLTHSDFWQKVMPDFTNFETRVQEFNNKLVEENPAKYGKERTFIAVQGV